MRCGSGEPPDDYVFPGGGHGIYTGGPKQNLMPRHSIIVETPPRWYGMAFDVHNATSVGTISGAPIGTWFRTWGPFFSTYTYQDIENSQPTVYMRASWQSVLFHYNDDYIMRCDGKGSYVRVSEGQHWFTNRVKNKLGFNQGYSLKIWNKTENGEEHIADAEETFHGTKSVTFLNATTDHTHNRDIGSATVSNEHNFAQWNVKSSYETTIPFYQTNAMSVLYAFRIYNLKTRSRSGKPQQPELAAVTDADKTQSEFVDADKTQTETKGDKFEHGKEEEVHA